MRALKERVDELAKIYVDKLSRRAGSVTSSRRSRSTTRCT
jgi:hypothetical protein